MSGMSGADTSNEEGPQQRMLEPLSLCLGSSDFAQCLSDLLKVIVIVHEPQMPGSAA